MIDATVRSLSVIVFGELSANPSSSVEMLAKPPFAYYINK